MRGSQNGLHFIANHCKCASYNTEVSRLGVVLCTILAFAACGKNIKTKAQVEEAILHRLQTSSGLDLKSLDVTTTEVSFQNNMAYATVAFHPKADVAINDALLMKYTLEDRNGKWAVVNVAGAHGQNMSGHGSVNTGALPPGHPPVKDVPDTTAPNSTALPSGRDQ